MIHRKNIYTFDFLFLVDLVKGTEWEKKKKKKGRNKKSAIDTKK